MMPAKGIRQKPLLDDACSSAGVEDMGCGMLGRIKIECVLRGLFFSGAAARLQITSKLHGLVVCLYVFIQPRVRWSKTKET
jgi:hypothetical protein